MRDIVILLQKQLKMIKTYRMLIDEYKKEGFIKDYSFYEKQLEKAENRPSSIGFFEGLPTKDE